MRFLDAGVVRAVLLRTWRTAARRPVLLTFSFVQPLVWMLFFGFLFASYRVGAGAFAGGDVRYLDFLAPGVSAMTVLFGASQAGIPWIRDWQSGFLRRCLHTPADRTSMLVGKVLADALRLCVQAAAVLLLALALGARLAPSAGGIALGLLHLFLFAVAFAALSCAIALHTRAPEAMAAFVHVVNMPLLFTSTALVPARQMPGWLAGIASANPLSVAVDSWRGAVLEGAAGTGAGLALLALLAVVLLALGGHALDRAARAAH